MTRLAWTLLVEAEGRPGDANMALDHGLLRAAREGAGFVRLYRWAPACLSFGRNEPARSRYDREAIARLGLDTVRRPTGGRAVWHDAELTYAVAAPCSAFGSLRETYVRIHRMLADALRGLGAPVELAGPVTSAPSRGPCFAAPAAGEVVSGGRKLVGSAQLREGVAFLQHGSILLENGQALVARVSTEVTCSPAATSLSDVVAGSSPPGFAEVAAAIGEAARRAWPGSWRHGEPLDAPDRGRYADPAWTWRS